jgi:hypothetical protein
MGEKSVSKTVLRRLAVLCVVGATAFGVTGGVANADKPTRGCPPAFDPVPVDPNVPTSVEVDKNDDGNVCVKHVGGTGPQAGDNYVDNTSEH